MKKIFIIIVALFMFPVVTLAAGINLSVDNTELTTDDVAHITVSISGSVDGGQVGLTGLENFEILGQESSQSIQIINGKTAQVQKKEIIVRPKQSGDFVITALARDNGKEISSNSVTISVEKSLLDSTKDDLLKKSQNDGVVDNNLDDIIGDQEPVSDFDDNLLKQSQIQSDAEDESVNANNDNSDNVNETGVSQNDDKQQLQINELEKFPKVEHLSEFNAMFWIEFIGIVLMVAFVVALLFFIIEKINK